VARRAVNASLAFKFTLRSQQCTRASSWLTALNGWVQNSESNVRRGQQPELLQQHGWRMLAEQVAASCSAAVLLYQLIVPQGRVWQSQFS
jgi:hypothetical protein